MRKRHRHRNRASSKKEAQRIHARKRFRSRFGIKFTKEIREEFVRQIQIGKARCLETQTLRISIFSVLFEERWIDVVYDKVRHEIVTCLPEPKAPEKNSAPPSNNDLQDNSSQP